MNKDSYKNLDPVWIKAALLGSIWGSVEIIIGSFLHNLRIPLTGTILSAIGVSILVGGQFIWQEKGIIWRAGVVCALMKAISPSAVILGPMIGIFTEALLLDIVVRFSRRTTIGLLIGGALTTCLPFLQNIISLIITYGFNITVLYVETFKFAVKHIGIKGIDAYDAINILFLLNGLFGAGAALLGISIGKRAQVVVSVPRVENNNDTAFSLSPVEPTSKFSIILLVSNIISIPLVLYAIGEMPFLWSSVAVVVYVVCAVMIYPQAWKRFSRPRIWIELVLVTLLAGLFLGEITNHNAQHTFSGLIVGIQMSLRAVFMVVSFNVISIELRNPKIIDWFLRIGFGKLASAMEIAFDALPTAISALGDQHKALRHPIISFSQLLIIAKNRLMLLENELIKSKRIFLLTGNSGAGKTTLLTKLLKEFRSSDVSVGGIISPVVCEQSTRIGYDVVDIRNQDRRLLCRIGLNGNGVKVGDFEFNEEGIHFGNEALSMKNFSKCKLIIVDEVGPLELEGKGWAVSLDRITDNLMCPLLLVVRESHIKKVMERWKFTPEYVWKIDHQNDDEFFKTIKVFMNNIG